MARQNKPRYANPINQAAVFARELQGLIVSVDVSTGDSDAGARVFGRIYTAQAEEERDASVTLLAELVEGTRRPDPLRELAEWLVSLDDPEDVDGREQRRTVTLDQIITRAREALGRKEG